MVPNTDYYLNNTQSSKIVRLVGGASERVYFRIFDGPFSKILAHYPKGIEASMKLFSYWQKFLCGLNIRVPEILGVGLDYFILEDLGNESLESVYLQGVDCFDQYLKESIDDILTLQAQSPIPHLPVCRRQLDYISAVINRFQILKESYPRFLEIPIIQQNSRILLQAISVLAKNLQSIEWKPYKLAISDYQSRNIFIKNGKLYHIDFQDIIIAPPLLDLSALLYDPYTEYPQNIIDRAMIYYKSKNDSQYSDEAFHYITIYKLLNACRVYCVLILDKERNEYLRPLRSSIALLKRLVE